jgi:fluoride exporter
MPQILIVFIGGGLGSICRYLLSKAIDRHFEFTFPLATLVVNVLGCFLIGVIYAIAEKYRISNNWNLLFTTGFCGGFTTFSTFAYENLSLLKSEQNLTFIGYSLLSFNVGILAVFLGMIAIKKG